MTPACCRGSSVGRVIHVAPRMTAADHEHAKDDRTWVESVLPPSGGTLRREPRMESEADAFARLAHELHDADRMWKRPSKESSNRPQP